MRYHLRYLFEIMLLTGILGLSASCYQGQDDLEITRLEINGGAVESGQPSVVFLYHGGAGAACTGTIIGQRVVLTAKHCVCNMDSYGNCSSMLSTSGFGVYIGTTPNLYAPPKYTVSEVRASSGTQITDNDIAVLLIAGVMTETPYPVLSSLPTNFINSQVYLIGYGLSACTGGSSGTKRRTEDQVVGYEGYNSFITQGLGANSGDSGGPVFTTDYKVVGVMVAVPQNYNGTLQCGTTICTRIDRYQSLIQQALEDTGGCYPTGPEICDDGVDNDCNNIVDDGCNPVGAACASNDDCASRLCYNLGAGLVCVQSCDPWYPGAGCVSGYYCREIDCDTGVCAPGVSGNAEVGAKCNQDTECGSLYCKTGSDGKGYCSVHCRPDQGECLPHEVCAPTGPSCGGCLPSAAFQGQRGIGEICQVGTNCRSSLCIEDQGAYYCSRVCGSNAECPDGFHCREDRCIRGYLGSEGDPCLVSADCLQGLTCYTGGVSPYCTRQQCEGTGCPTGMVCSPVGATSVCTMNQAPVGSRCSSAGECLTVGCISFDGDASCSLTCGRLVPCPTGTFCTMSDSGQLACAPNSLPPVIVDPGGGGGLSKGGCNQAPPGQGVPWPVMMAFLILLSVFWRRRR
ncbi:MAG: S1 family peptidase [Polyangia bacterium]|nr:S1 family peptidase [Polyangia bacterium]